MTPPRILITGANGFVGAHVAEAAAMAGARVTAVGREPRPSRRLAAFCDHYITRDLSEGWVGDQHAEAIVHLAGLAAVGPSFDHPQRYISVNSGIATHMFESLLASEDRPRVIVVSSGAVYAPPPRPDAGISETSPTHAGSPYAVAKLTVEQQAEYYAARGLDTVVARPFNHIGPGQGRGFLVPDLSDALRGLSPGAPLRPGNLRTARDYTDVRDVARAYVTLSLAPTHRHGVYNVSSGESHSGFDVLSVLCESLGRAVPEVVIDPAKVRPTDVPRITGDSTRLQDEFGWQPQVPWKQSIHDFVNGTE